MTNVYGSVGQALTHLLLRVHATHKTLLTRQQMQILLSLLIHPKTDTTLTLAILRALQQIGDESAIKLLTISSGSLLIRKCKKPPQSAWSI